LFIDINTNKKDDSLYTQFLTDVANTKDGKMAKEELSKKYEPVFDRVTMDYKDYVKKYPSTDLKKEQYLKLQDAVARHLWYDEIHII